MVRTSWRCLAIIALSLSALSCKDGGNIPVQSLSIPIGAFQYTGYDEAGNIIETGWLKLVVSDPNNVVGTWQLHTRGSGELRGAIENGRVVVDLNPRFVDNNFILDGTIQNGIYSGSWSQIGFGGVMGSGRFEARQ